MTGSGEPAARGRPAASGRSRRAADYRVAIVGGRGLLGRALQRCIPDGWAVYAPGRTPSDQGEAPVHEIVDLESPATLESFLEAHPCDAVVLTAAWTAVDACEADPDRAMRLNGEAPGLLAEIAADRGLAFLYLSTDYAFDGGFPDGRPRPYREDDDPRPQSVYARSKVYGEREVAKAYGTRPGSNARHLIVRASGLYGPGGPDFVHAVAPRLNGGVQVVDDQRLSPTCVDDLAPALWSLLASDARGLFHLTASGGGVSWYEFSRRMAAVLGFDAGTVRATTTEAFGRPAARPAYSVLDCVRAEAVLGRPLPSWEDGLMRFLQAHGAGWRREAAGPTEGSGG